MLLLTAASAVVIKRKPEPGNDDLRGNDDSKNYDARAAHDDSRVLDTDFETFGLVSRLGCRVGHWQPSHAVLLLQPKS
jgi:hypothetical protein